MEVCHYSYFQCCGYFWGSWASFSMTDEFSPGLTNELTAYLSVFNLFLIQWIMAILSKGCKPDNFESHNFLKLNFTNNQGLHLNFVKSESFLESNSPDKLNKRRDKLGWLNWFRQFLCKGLSFFNPKKIMLRNVSLKSSADSYLCSEMSLLHSVSLFFFSLSITFFIFMHSFRFYFI